MIQTSTRSITLDDFLRQPETKPASEYIDGRIIQKPMAQGEHSTLQRVLIRDIDNALSPTKIAHAYPELRCTFGGLSIVPDVSVFRWDRIPRRANGRVANRFELHPDWVIEILSPGQSQTQVVRNIRHCLDHGTEMGWFIEPGRSCILAYQPNHSPQTIDQPQMIMSVPDLALEQITLTVR